MRGTPRAASAQAASFATPIPLAQAVSPAGQEPMVCVQALAQPTVALVVGPRSGTTTPVAMLTPPATVVGTITPPVAPLGMPSVAGYSVAPGTVSPSRSFGPASGSVTPPPLMSGPVPALAAAAFAAASAASAAAASLGVVKGAAQRRGASADARPTYRDFTGSGVAQGRTSSRDSGPTARRVAQQRSSSEQPSKPGVVAIAGSGTTISASASDAQAHRQVLVSPLQAQRQLLASPIGKGRRLPAGLSTTSPRRHSVAVPGVGVSQQAAQRHSIGVPHTSNSCQSAEVTLKTAWAQLLDHVERTRPKPSPDDTPRKKQVGGSLDLPRLRQLCQTVAALVNALPPEGLLRRVLAVAVEELFSAAFPDYRFCYDPRDDQPESVSELNEIALASAVPHVVAVQTLKSAARDAIMWRLEHTAMGAQGAMEPRETLEDPADLQALYGIAGGDEFRLREDLRHAKMLAETYQTRAKELEASTMRLEEEARRFRQEREAEQQKADEEMRRLRSEAEVLAAAARRAEAVAVAARAVNASETAGSLRSMSTLQTEGDLLVKSEGALPTMSDSHPSLSEDLERNFAPLPRRKEVPSQQPSEEPSTVTGSTSPYHSAGYEYGGPVFSGGSSVTARGSCPGSAIMTGNFPGSAVMTGTGCRPVGSARATQGSAAPSPPATGTPRVEARTVRSAGRCTASGSVSAPSSRGSVGAAAGNVSFVAFKDSGSEIGSGASFDTAASWTSALQGQQQGAAASRGVTIVKARAEVKRTREVTPALPERAGPAWAGGSVRWR